MNKKILAVLIILSSVIVYASNFSDISQSDFNNGTYANTSYNGAGVILSGSNLSGTYTSRVFDAGSAVRLDNLTSNYSLTTQSYLFAVDYQASIWKSNNSGINWTKINDSYKTSGVTADDLDIDSSGSLYILDGQDLWKSSDSGATWVKVNDDFNGADAHAGLVMRVGGDNSIYIVDSSEDVYKSNNSGQNFSLMTSNFNAAYGNVYGIAINSTNSIFAVDYQASIWKSNNSGINWTKINDSYKTSGVTADDLDIDSSGSLYILDGQDLWKSSDSGATWVKVNDDFNGAGDGEAGKQIVIGPDGIYALDAGEDVYKSTDGGLTFTKIRDDLNAANGDVYGATYFGAVTNISFQVRNCSANDCSDGAWQAVNLSNVNLSGRYFQYKASFSSQDSAISPQLYNVTLGYAIIDNTPPSMINYLASPSNNSAYVSGQSYQFFVSITDSSGIGRAGIEWQGVNYSVTNVSSIYTFTRSNLAAGTYNYYWWVNDSYGNMNTSGMKSYAVAKGNPSSNMQIAGTSPITYGTTSNFAGSETNSGDSACAYSLDRTNQVYGGGTWTFNYSTSGCANYSAGSVTKDLIVNPAASSTSLSFDKSSPQPYGIPVTPSCSVVVGVGNSILTLDGNVIASGESLVMSSGNHNFNCSLASSQNYSASSLSASYEITNANGDIKLYLNGQEDNLTTDYPKQYNVTATTLYGIISIYDDGVDITSSNGQNITPSGASAYHNITAFSSGDANHSPVSVTRWLNITLDTTPPSLSVSLPQEGATYGSNNSISLNYSVSDVNLQSCWYSLGAGNVSLNSCQNSIFNVAGSGSYAIYVYANDSLGNLAMKSANFSVNIGAPTINLNSPIGSYLNIHNATFKYVPEDIDLNYCELWGNFDGEFKLNQTDNSPVSGSENKFTLVLGDGSYLWNIRCFDLQGRGSFNGNKSFYIDTIAPSIAISQPAGSKTSRSSIPLEYSVSDSSPKNCWYNVEWSTGGSVITNTSITNCSSTSFSVSADGSYVLNLFANDSAGNFNSDSSSFSISSSSTGGNTGGSIGGGGGGYTYGVDFSMLSSMIVNPSDSKKISVTIKNTGTGFLNECKIKGSGENSEWVSSDDNKGISPGQIQEFIFNLDVPAAAGNGQHLISIFLDCKEFSYSYNFSAEILEKKIEISILEAKKDGNNLKVNYYLQEYSGISQEVDVQIILLGESNEKVAEFSEKRMINPGEKSAFTASVPIPEGLVGNYNLVINVKSAIASSFMQQEVLIGESRISGFAVFNSALGKYILGVVIIGLLIFTAFMLRRVIHLKKAVRVKRSVKVRGWEKIRK